MSVKAKIAAGAATLTIVGGGLGMVGTMTASAATPPCGTYAPPASPTTPSTGCAQIFSQKFGPTSLLDVYQAKAKAGQPVILFQRSNSDPAEDWAIKGYGTVGGFYTTYALVSSSFAHTYSADNVYEIQYEPYGVNSNFCASTWPGVAPSAGYKVQLEWCGKYSNSLWAADTTDTTPIPGAGTATDYRSTGGIFSNVDTDVALINGADDNFSNPLVMNYPAGNPTDMPRVQLTVQPESSYSDNTIFDNQEWGTRAGLVDAPPVVP
ncbi:MAG: hypothetical protein JO016_05980 [Actinobacteria bacterium]|jgi:hypothetical protein|nr:hypothetical protein [Actinomycetota bacterium]